MILVKLNTLLFLIFIPQIGLACVENELNSALKFFKENKNYSELKSKEKKIYIMQSNSENVDVAIVGLISCRKISAYENIELVWWKSRNSKLRSLCIASILLKEKGSDHYSKSMKLLFTHSKRFSEIEKNIRSKEIADVAKNIKVYIDYFAKLDMLSEKEKKQRSYNLEF